MNRNLLQSYAERLARTPWLSTPLLLVMAPLGLFLIKFTVLLVHTLLIFPAYLLFEASSPIFTVVFQVSGPAWTGYFWARFLQRLRPFLASSTAGRAVGYACGATIVLYLALPLTSSLAWDNLMAAGITVAVTVFVLRRSPRSDEAEDGRPQVLFLRRFAGFADRALSNAVLKAVPAGYETTQFVDPRQSLSTWDPLLLAFSGFRFRQPFVLPSFQLARTEGWLDEVRALMDRAECIVFDLSEPSDSLALELDVLALGGHAGKSVFLVRQDAREERNSLWSRAGKLELFAEGAEVIVFRKSWSGALARIVFAFSGLLVFLVLGADAVNRSLLALVPGWAERLGPYLFNLSLWALSAVFFTLFVKPQVDRTSTKQLVAALWHRLSSDSLRPGLLSRLTNAYLREEWRGSGPEKRGLLGLLSSETILERVRRDLVRSFVALLLLLGVLVLMTEKVDLTETWTVWLLFVTVGAGFWQLGTGSLRTLRFFFDAARREADDEVLCSFVRQRTPSDTGGDRERRRIGREIFLDAVLKAEKRLGLVWRLQLAAAVGAAIWVGWRGGAESALATAATVYAVCYLLGYRLFRAHLDGALRRELQLLAPQPADVRWLVARRTALGTSVEPLLEPVLQSYVVRPKETAPPFDRRRAVVLGKLAERLVGRVSARRFFEEVSRLDRRKPGWLDRFLALALGAFCGWGADDGLGWWIAGLLVGYFWYFMLKDAVRAARRKTFELALTVHGMSYDEYVRSCDEVRDHAWRKGENQEKALAALRRAGVRQQSAAAKRRDARTSVVAVEGAYDAFLSYSHVGDRPLAVALQHALQRFAKPWFQRRSVRIFRDETSLPLSSTLWSSIEEALAGSRFLLLAVSPHAARSEWIEREIRYWLEHKDPRNLLLVLTAGELVWSEELADFDAESSSALPESLRGVFSEEPFYLDLRWVRRAPKTAVKSSDFQDAVATIAARLRSLPKDDLFSEEVRQQRRVLRLAWTVAAALMLLAVAAVFFGFLADLRRRSLQDELARAQWISGVSYRDEDLAPLRSAHAFVRAAALESDVNRSEEAQLAAAVLPRGATLEAVYTTYDARWGRWSSPGRELLVGRGPGTTIVVWDPLRGEEPVLELEHPATPAGVLLADEEALLLSWTEVGEVHLWDLRSGEASIRPFRPEERCKPVDFSVEERLVLCTDRQSARVWDLETGQPAGPELRHDGEPISGVQLFDHAMETLGVDTPIFSAVRFAAQGSRVLTAASDGILRIRASRGGHEVSPPIRIRVHTGRLLGSPDGSQVLLSGNYNSHPETIPKNVTQWELISGVGEEQTEIWDVSGDARLLRRLQLDDTEVDWFLAGTSGFKFVAWSWEGKIGIWDFRTQERVAPLMDHGADIRSVFLGLGDRVLLSWDKFGTLKRWDVESGKLLGTLVTGGPIDGVALHPTDGSLLTWNQSEGLARLWRSGAVLPVVLPHGENLAEGFFLPDSRTLLTRGSGSLRRWRLDSSSRPLAVAAEGLEGVVLSPDGRSLAVRSFDAASASGLVQAFDLQTGLPRTPPLIHGRDVQGVVFADDGQSLLSWSGNLFGLNHNLEAIPESGAARLWDLGTGDPLGDWMRHDAAVLGAAFQPQGDLVLTWGDDAARLWSAETGESVQEPFRHRSPIDGARFNDDGSRVLTWGGSNHPNNPDGLLGEVRLWDVASGAPLTPPLEHPTAVVDAWLLDDSKRLVTLYRGRSPILGKSALLWTLGDAEPSSQRIGLEERVRDVVSNPAGDRLLVLEGGVNRERPGRIWRLDTELTPEGEAPPGDFSNGVFLRDGRVLLWGANDLVVWDVERSEQHPLQGHRGPIRQILPIEDAGRIVSNDEEGDVWLWDLETGKPVCPPLRHRRLAGMDVSPDRRRLLTWDQNGTSILWSVTTGHPLTPPLVPAGGFPEAVSPSGYRAFFASDDHFVVHSRAGFYVWDLTIDRGLPRHRLALELEARTGSTTDTVGRVVTLEASSWRERSARYAAFIPRHLRDHESAPAELYVRELLRHPEACLDFPEPILDLLHRSAVKAAVLRHCLARSEEKAAARRWDEAAGILNGLLDLEPEEARVHARLAAVQLGLKDPEAAVRHARRSLELDPRQPPDTAAVLVAALVDEGDPTALAEAWISLGRRHARWLDPASAVDAYRRAVEIHPEVEEEVRPELARSLRDVAMQLLRGGEPREALRRLDEALRHGFGDRDAVGLFFHLALQYVHADEGLFPGDKSIRKLEAMIPTAELRFHFEDYLGSFYHGRGDYDAALAAYHKALSAKPGDGGVFLRRARVLAESDRPEESVRDFRRAFGSLDDAGEVFAGLYRILKDGGHEAAIGILLRDAGGFESEDPDSHRRRGEVLEAEGRRREAADAFRRMIALGRDDCEAYDLLRRSSPELFEGVEGVLVAAVDGDSPARAAGLRPGDILLTYAGEGANRVEQLDRIMRSRHREPEVRITLLRGEHRQNVSLPGGRVEGLRLRNIYSDYPRELREKVEFIIENSPFLDEVRRRAWIAAVPRLDFALVERLAGALMRENFRWLEREVTMMKLVTKDD